MFVQRDKEKLIYQAGGKNKYNHDHAMASAPMNRIIIFL